MAPHMSPSQGQVLGIGCEVRVFLLGKNYNAITVPQVYLQIGVVFHLSTCLWHGLELPERKLDMSKTNPPPIAILSSQVGRELPCTLLWIRQHGRSETVKGVGQTAVFNHNTVYHRPVIAQVYLKHVIIYQQSINIFATRWAIYVSNCCQKDTFKSFRVLPCLRQPLYWQVKNLVHRSFMVWIISYMIYYGSYIYIYMCIYSSIT